MIGLAANVDLGKIAISKNGKWAGEACGVVFEDEAIKAGVFPYMSAGGYTIRYSFADFKHGAPPLGADVWNS